MTDPLGFAIVDQLALVSTAATVGPWCWVGPNVRIGAGSRLLQHVVVQRDTTLGEHNIVHPFAVLGGEPQDLGHAGERTTLSIGDRNVIREHVTINVGTAAGGGMTWLGNDNLVMSACHVGHDARIGSRCVIGSGTCIAGHVEVHDFVWLGGNVSVAQRVRIGAYAFVGGHSGIDRDVPPFCIAYGDRPRTVRGANLRGLRRCLDRASVTTIRGIVGLWKNPEGTWRDAIARIRGQYPGDDLAKVFTSFVEASEGSVLR